MVDQTNSEKVTLEELMVSTLGMTDALAKLMIAKGMITDTEFKARLSTERANYFALLKHLVSRVLMETLIAFAIGLGNLGQHARKGWMPLSGLINLARDPQQINILATFGHTGIL
jgi:hypothetical protein